MEVVPVVRVSSVLFGHPPRLLRRRLHWSRDAAGPCEAEGGRRKADAHGKPSGKYQNFLGQKKSKLAMVVSKNSATVVCLHSFLSISRLIALQARRQDAKTA